MMMLLYKILVNQDPMHLGQLRLQLNCIASKMPHEHKRACAASAPEVHVACRSTGRP